MFHRVQYFLRGIMRDTLFSTQRPLSHKRNIAGKLFSISLFRQQMFRRSLFVSHQFMLLMQKTAYYSVISPSCRAYTTGEKEVKHSQERHRLSKKTLFFQTGYCVDVSSNTDNRNSNVTKITVKPRRVLNLNAFSWRTYSLYRVKLEGLNSKHQNEQTAHLIDTEGQKRYFTF